MDDPAMLTGRHLVHAVRAEAPPVDVVSCPVADTMRRVHEQLRRGAAPTFEALFAFGEPGRR
jgi:hypothetical protein